MTPVTDVLVNSISAYELDFSGLIPSNVSTNFSEAFFTLIESSLASVVPTFAVTLTFVPSARSAAADNSVVATIFLAGMVRVVGLSVAFSLSDVNVTVVSDLEYLLSVTVSVTLPPGLIDCLSATILATETGVLGSVPVIVIVFELLSASVAVTVTSPEAGIVSVNVADVWPAGIVTVLFAHVPVPQLRLIVMSSVAAALSWSVKSIVSFQSADVTSDVTSLSTVFVTISAAERGAILDFLKS